MKVDDVFDKLGLIFIALFVLTINISVSQAYDFGHDGEFVILKVGNTEHNLQEATVRGSLKVLTPFVRSPSDTYTPSNAQRHLAHQVELILGDGSESTLQRAIDENKLCIPGSNIKDYQNIPNPGHVAEEIYIQSKGVEKSLQQAIFDLDFCPDPPFIPLSCDENDVQYVGNPQNMPNLFIMDGGIRHLKNLSDGTNVLGPVFNWRGGGEYFSDDEYTINGFTSGAQGTADRLCQLALNNPSARAKWFSFGKLNSYDDEEMWVWYNKSDDGYWAQQPSGGRTNINDIACTLCEQKCEDGNKDYWEACDYNPNPFYTSIPCGNCGEDLVKTCRNNCYSISTFCPGGYQVGTGRYQCP